MLPLSAHAPVGQNPSKLGRPEVSRRPDQCKAQLNNDLDLFVFINYVYTKVA